MNFKTHKILLFLFLSIVLFTVFGCDKKQSIATNLFHQEKTVSSSEMCPRRDSLPKLDAHYVEIKKNEIDTYFAKKWKTSFDNVSFLVAKNGQIIYEKYAGFADKNNTILNSPNVPLHLASVSKVLTASAILKLIDDQKLALEDKVTKYLPEFPYPQVTIKTLLNHRSGMKKYSNFADDATIWGRNKILTDKDVLTILATKNIPLDYKTDTHFSYCNTNYVMLALIIEKVTGLRYREAMKKIIFEPLGMTNTYVLDETSAKNAGTPSYKGNYIKYSFDFLDAVYGDKNIYSTPRDLLKFDNARSAATFLSKNLLDQVFKGYSYESKGERNYGLGIRMREWKTGQTLFYHNGWWHGNTSSYITLRNENVVIIALSNKFTHKTYQVKNLSALFGDYPFKLDEEKEE